MKKSVISKLLTELEKLVQTEFESGVEFWLARDLQQILGYANWQNFRKVILSAVTACETSGNKAFDHFTEVSKMIALGNNPPNIPGKQQPPLLNELHRSPTSHLLEPINFPSHSALATEKISTPLNREWLLKPNQ